LALSKQLVIAPSEIALAKTLVSEMDLLRPKTIARLHARGLPPEYTWDDLLQEAFARVLSGARQPPPGVSTVAFIAGVMRSLRSEYWRRKGQDEPLDVLEYEHRSLQVADDSTDPERAVSAYQELAGLAKLIEGDAVALQIITGLAEGLDAEEIRVSAAVSKTSYDSARKRIRRTLLREGLRFCLP
jgi:DNA-directed RNA polymerase specialized sigma24 family protein